jgi:hypothetical protein
MQSFSALALPIVSSLGASGYPALQTFLSHIMDNNKNFLLVQEKKKVFFILLAAAIVEMIGELL